MKVIISNKALRYINFRLIPDMWPGLRRGSNRSESYVYMIYKKEKRYTLEDNNPLIRTNPHELFIWPYKNLTINVKDLCLEMV